MIKEFNSTLHRFDLKQPPTEWDTTFLSCEYHYAKHGHKNKANLFFFTDSLELAKTLGESSAEGYSKTVYFLTSTQTIKLKLIDLSNSDTIYKMLCVLKELNIDVLTNDFRTYENDNDFGQLKCFFDAALIEPDSCKRFNIIKNLKMHSTSDFMKVGLFGQRLTDFDNGIKFKQLVMENHPEADGYVWEEYGCGRGLTYCLFDSQKLISKETEKVEIINKPGVNSKFA